MKELCVEYGYTSLNHVGEELCGDNVEMCVRGEWTTLVLADGLGSGVKANILSTLTSKILCTMVAGGVNMEECISTIISTLPVCHERQVAYSTFSVIHVDNQGRGHLFEFDNPEAIWYHRGHTQDFPREELEICGKKVFHAPLELESGDMVFVMSDGTIHAGIGQILNFGWQRKEIMEHLDQNIDAHMSARAAACLLASACNDLYLDRPGDDTTVAAIRVRPRCEVHIMVGPPVDKEKDAIYVQHFMEGADKRIVCGGTTSQVVARCIGREVKTSFDFPDKEVPPIGFIDGIDLTTEGVITMRRLLALCRERDMTLIADECFLDFCEEADIHSLIGALAETARLVILRAFTKTYAMAGLRLGCALCGSAALAEKLQACGQPWAVSDVAQAAGIAALQDKDYVNRLRALISAERKRMIPALEGLGLRVIPGEANFLLFRADDPALCQKLRERGILIRGCGNFAGLDINWYRAAIRTEKENDRLLKALREVLHG